jgi:hypothetical protein
MYLKVFPFLIFSAICSFSLSPIMNSIMKGRAKDGIWNRCIVAGVKPEQILTSHVIEGFIIILIHFIEFSCYAFYFFGNIPWSSFVLLLVILFLTASLGLMLAACFSVTCDSCFAATLIVSYFSMSMVLTSGNEISNF